MSKLALPKCMLSVCQVYAWFLWRLKDMRFLELELQTPCGY